MRYVSLMIVLLAPAWAATHKAEHGILVGEVLRLDAAAKTVTVKAADGTEHTLHFAKETVMHPVRSAKTGAKDSFAGLQTGTEVAVRYSAKGTEETAEEIDRIGAGGLKTMEGTVTRVDRGAKTVSVKTAGGTEETLHLTEAAARDTGEDTAKAGRKSGKVTVYYTEEAGHKVAHFLKWAI